MHARESRLACRREANVTFLLKGSWQPVCFARPPRLGGKRRLPPLAVGGGSAVQNDLMNGIFHSGSLIIPATYFLPPSHLLSQLALLAAPLVRRSFFLPSLPWPGMRFDNYGKSRQGRITYAEGISSPDRVQLAFSGSARLFRPR